MICYLSVVNAEKNSFLSRFWRVTWYCSKHGFGSNPMNGIIYREIRLDERKKRGESLHMHMTMLGNHKLATATSPNI